MREATGDGQEPLAFGSSQVACDEQKASLEHVTDGLLNGCAFARQAARIQDCFQAPKKRVDLVMARIVIEDLIQNPFVLSIADGRQDARGALIEFIDSHRARKGLKRPVQKRTAHLTLRLFSPQPRPSFGSWQRAQTRGDRATGASWWAGRASRLRPPGAPPAA